MNMVDGMIAIFKVVSFGADAKAFISLRINECLRVLTTELVDTIFNCPGSIPRNAANLLKKLRSPLLL